MSELEILSRQNTECRVYIEKKRSKTHKVKELIAAHLHSQPRFETICAILERQEELLQQQKALIQQQKELIAHLTKKNKMPNDILH
jgi:type II secretory pathway predicted ATPase ExeA